VIIFKALTWLRQRVGSRLCTGDRRKTDEEKYGWGIGFKRWCIFTHENLLAPLDYKNIFQMFSSMLVEVLEMVIPI
jgi:hypothetical protein